MEFSYFSFGWTLSCAFFCADDIPYNYDSINMENWTALWLLPAAICIVIVCVAFASSSCFFFLFNEFSFSVHFGNLCETLRRWKRWKVTQRSEDEERKRRRNTQLTTVFYCEMRIHSTYIPAVVWLRESGIPDFHDSFMAPKSFRLRFCFTFLGTHIKFRFFHLSLSLYLLDAWCTYRCALSSSRPRIHLALAWIFGFILVSFHTALHFCRYYKCGAAASNRPEPHKTDDDNDNSDSGSNTSTTTTTTKHSMEMQARREK